jgi:hypothetical protein
VKSCIFEYVFTVNIQTRFDKSTVTANKAKRQTIPAFHLREKWMIDEEFIPTNQ